MLLLALALAVDPGLASIRAADARVATVAHRLQMANVALCRDVEPLPGFVIHHGAQYAPPVRQALGLDEQAEVVAVVPGSAAARAGLRAGDRIVGIDGKSASYPAADRPSADAVVAIRTRIAEAIADSTLDLTLADRSISIAGKRGCVSAVERVPGPRVNAEADGRVVLVHGGVLDFARSDDELAFTIAHELAHNILRHPTGPGRDTRRIELEADRFAVWLVARAGYDIDAILPYRARLNRKFGASATHPPPKARLAALAKAVAEVKAQRAGGKPLIPTQ